jgi:hypothetical protein
MRSAATLNRSARSKLIATTDHPVHTQEKKPASILDG